MSNAPDTPAVYTLTHVPTGTFYVGSTKNLKKRLRQHKLALKNGTHHNPPLQKCNTGWSDIQVEYTELSDLETARTLENSLICKNEGNPKFANVVGPDNDKGVKRSIETRQKMSSAKIGIKRSPEVCKSISDNNKGRKRSPETCKRMSEANLGRKHTPETVENNRELKSIPVVIDGVRYSSGVAAGKVLGVHKSSVNRRIHSKLEQFKEWNVAPKQDQHSSA